MNQTMARALAGELARAFRVELVDGRWGPYFRVVRVRDGAHLCMLCTRQEAEQWIARYGALYREG